MTLHRLAAPLAALCFLAAALPASGCDSTADDRLDAAFFVGTWTVVATRDGSGDRTASFNALLDDFGVVFRSDDTFTLDADFSAIAEAGGATDVSLTGSYAVADLGETGLSPTLVLTTPVAAAPLTVNVISDSRVELSAPAAIVAAILGNTGSALGLTGTVVLTITR